MKKYHPAELPVVTSGSPRSAVHAAEAKIPIPEELEGVVSVTPGSASASPVEGLFTPNPDRNGSDAAAVAQKYEEFALRRLRRDGVTPGVLSPHFGQLSTDAKYLFVETKEAKQAAEDFQCFFYGDARNKQLSNDVFIAKEKYIRLSVLAEKGQPLEAKAQINHKCIGFTPLERQRDGDKPDQFCLVTLSGTLENKSHVDIANEVNNDYPDLPAEEREELVTATFEYLQLEIKLSAALRAAAKTLNNKSTVKYIFHDNPSENLRNLVALKSLVDKTSDAGCDWKRPCAELTAVQMIVELWSRSKYRGTLTINGGMYLLLPRPDQWNKSEIKLKSRDTKKGKFVVAAGDESFKAAPIPCCSHCQARKDTAYLPIMGAAIPSKVLAGSMSAEAKAGVSSDSVTPVHSPLRPDHASPGVPLSGDHQGNRFELTPYVDRTAEAKSGKNPARRIDFGGSPVKPGRLAAQLAELRRGGDQRESVFTGAGLFGKGVGKAPVVDEPADIPKPVSK